MDSWAGEHSLEMAANCIHQAFFRVHIRGVREDMCYWECRCPNERRLQFWKSSLQTLCLPCPSPALLLFPAHVHIEQLEYTRDT